MRMPWVVAIVAVACLAAVPARAQTLDEVLNELGPSATQIQAENLSGALYTSPRMIEILQAYGVDPAFQTTVDEARWVVRFDREDRELGKLAALNEKPFELRSPVVRTVALMLVSISCAEAKQKADAADRLSTALWGASMLNAAGAGLLAATGAGVVFAGPLAFAASVTSIASTAAGKVAARYRGAACTARFGEETCSPSTKLLQASLGPNRFRIQRSSRGVSGSWQAA